MSRMEEYDNLMQELAMPVPGLENTLHRAKVKRIRRMVVRPLVQLAVTFGVFVALVNFCTPVAYACSKVPILKDLAEAVTFSKSLTDAVDNEYVQPLYLSQEDGGVTASVEYLIVDQKQVNVFFRLDSETYASLDARPGFLSVDGTRPTACSYGLNNFGTPNGELQSVTIDFVEGNVPDKLRLQLDIYSQGSDAGGMTAAPESSTDVMFTDVPEEEPEYFAHFDFLLEFDPEFTATGKVFTINETIVLDGQEITFTEMEVYPTHLRVNVTDSGDNTAWLKGLDFYIETDWGMQFETISNGISATGSPDSPSMASFRADSSYFYEAKHLEIVVTGAEWLNKDMEKSYINLQTGETEALPEDVELYAATRVQGGWLLTLEAKYRKPNHHHQLFGSRFYDAEGKEYEINAWSTTFGEPDENGEILTFREEIPLKDYPYEEVWLRPRYSHVWTADEPVRVRVQ